jgi:hypothetical protein
LEVYRPFLMQIIEGKTSFPPDMAWAPYEPSVGYVLSPGDGYKTVSARLMDAAGNIGSAGFARIILDTTAPVTTITDFPNISTKASINISWKGYDALSGVLWYDIQSRTGDGPWTDLLVHTCATSVVFTGEDGKTYSFRARAQDRAGSLEEFPATAEQSVTIRLLLGAPTIITPAQNATVSGKIWITGRCQPGLEGILPTLVLVSVDDAPWEPATGVGNWSFYLDTTKLSDGNHMIRVRSFDGSQYSAETECAVTVRNVGVRGFDMFPALSIGLVVVIIVAIMIIIMKRKMRIPKAPPAERLDSHGDDLPESGDQRL